MASTGTILEVLAGFASELEPGDLPPEVLDKAKACTLHNLLAGLLGIGSPVAQGAARLVATEEPLAEGATLIGHATRTTKGGAAFANGAAMNITNQCDSYYMLTHPGPCVVPAALATAETQGCSGPDLLTALVVGYEVQCRLARDLIPTTQARGFRSAPVYGVVGTAAAVAKLLGLDAGGIRAAMALAATAASGTSECARTGTNEHHFHEPVAARNGVLAGLYAPTVPRVSTTAIEGEAGFYNAFTGSHTGRITHSFTDASGEVASLDNVTSELGSRYEILNVTFKPFPTPGFNNPVLELMTRILATHTVDVDAIAVVEIELNELELTYPSPAFPRPELHDQRVGTSAHAVAQILTDGFYPRYGQWFEHGLGLGEPGETKGLEDVRKDLMDRVTFTATRDRSYFQPGIRITMTDGSAIAKELAGDELKWDFAEAFARAMGAKEGVQMPGDEFDRLLEEIGRLDGAATAASVMSVVDTGYGGWRWP